MKKIFILLAFIAIFNLDTLQINGASNSDTQTGNQDLDWQLFQAVINNNINEIQRLIYVGADINALNQINGTSYRPLHLAARLGDSDMVRVLIYVGADINLQNKYGDTPLHLAARHNCTNVARALIEAGAKINAQDQNNNTPLHLAANWGNTDIAQALIDAGADMNIKNKDGYTPLQWAVGYNNADIAQLLIDGGADVNLSNSRGMTPLHSAAIDNNTNVARALIEAGASINAESNNGNTPISLAQGETQQLLQNIVNVEQQLEKIIPGGPIKPILDKYNADFKKSIIKRLIFKKDESFEKDRFDLVARAEKAYPELEINVLLQEIIERSPGIYKEYKEFLAQEKMRKQLLKEQYQGSFADVEIAREQEEAISTDQKSEKKSDTLSRKRKRE